MKRVLCVSCLLLVLAALPSCRSSKHGPEGTQEQFGVNMAKMHLWREALFRFKRAVEISPADAQAHNNLAVAYEANGDFEAAAKEYREAMRLDKSNTYIQKNYSRLVEFTSRNKKRQRPAAAPGKPSATEAAATPATSAAVPPPTSSTPPAEPVKQEPPPTLQGIGGSGAPPATKPAAVPSPAPTGPPPTPAGTPQPPPPGPAKSGGQP